MVAVPEAGPSVRLTPESGQLAEQAREVAAVHESGCGTKQRPIRSPRRRGRALSSVRRDRAFGGFEVDRQHVLSRCLHRQVAWLLAFKNAIDVAGRALVLVDLIRPVGGEATVR